VNKATNGEELLVGTSQLGGGAGRSSFEIGKYAGGLLSFLASQ